MVGKHYPKRLRMKEYHHHLRESKATFPEKDQSAGSLIRKKKQSEDLQTIAENLKSLNTKRKDRETRKTGKRNLEEKKIKEEPARKKMIEKGQDQKTEGSLKISNRQNIEKNLRIAIDWVLNKKINSRRSNESNDTIGNPDTVDHDLDRDHGSVKRIRTKMKKGIVKGENLQVDSVRKRRGDTGKDRMITTEVKISQAREYIRKKEKSTINNDKERRTGIHLEKRNEKDIENTEKEITENVSDPDLENEIGSVIEKEIEKDSARDKDSARGNVNGSAIEKERKKETALGIGTEIEIEIEGIETEEKEETDREIGQFP